MRAGAGGVQTRGAGLALSLLRNRNPGDHDGRVTMAKWNGQTGKGPEHDSVGEDDLTRPLREMRFDEDATRPFRPAELIAVRTGDALKSPVGGTGAGEGGEDEDEDDTDEEDDVDDDEEADDDGGVAEDVPVAAGVLADDEDDDDDEDDEDDDEGEDAV